MKKRIILFFLTYSYFITASSWQSAGRPQASSYDPLIIEQTIKEEFNKNRPKKPIENWKNYASEEDVHWITENFSNQTQAQSEEDVNWITQNFSNQTQAQKDNYCNILFSHFDRRQIKELIKQRHKKGSGQFAIAQHLLGATFFRIIDVYNNANNNLELTMQTLLVQDALLLKGIQVHTHDLVGQIHKLSEDIKQRAKEEEIIRSQISAMEREERKLVINAEKEAQEIAQKIAEARAQEKAQKRVQKKIMENLSRLQIAEEQERAAITSNNESNRNEQAQEFEATRQAINKRTRKKQQKTCMYQSQQLIYEELQNRSIVEQEEESDYNELLSTIESTKQNIDRAQIEQQLREENTGRETLDNLEGTEFHRLISNEKNSLIYIKQKELEKQQKEFEKQQKEFEKQQKEFEKQQKELSLQQKKTKNKAYSVERRMQQHQETVDQQRMFDLNNNNNYQGCYTEPLSNCHQTEHLFWQQNAGYSGYYTGYRQIPHHLTQTAALQTLPTQSSTDRDTRRHYSRSTEELPNSGYRHIFPAVQPGTQPLARYCPNYATSQPEPTLAVETDSQRTDVQRGQNNGTVTRRNNQYNPGNMFDLSTN